LALGTDCSSPLLGVVTKNDHTGLAIRWKTWLVKTPTKAKFAPNKSVRNSFADKLVLGILADHHFIEQPDGTHDE